MPVPAAPNPAPTPPASPARRRATSCRGCGSWSASRSGESALTAPATSRSRWWAAAPAGSITRPIRRRCARSWTSTSCCWRGGRRRGAGLPGRRGAGGPLSPGSGPRVMPLDGSRGQLRAVPHSCCRRLRGSRQGPEGVGRPSGTLRIALEGPARGRPSVRPFGHGACWKRDAPGSADLTRTPKAREWKTGDPGGRVDRRPRESSCSRRPGEVPFPRPANGALRPSKHPVRFPRPAPPKLSGRSSAVRSTTSS